MSKPLETKVIPLFIADAIQTGCARRVQRLRPAEARGISLQAQESAPRIVKNIHSHLVPWTSLRTRRSWEYTPPSMCGHKAVYVPGESRSKSEVWLLGNERLTVFWSSKRYSVEWPAD
jgi:hypothetical protein